MKKSIIDIILHKTTGACTPMWFLRVAVIIACLIPFLSYASGPQVLVQGSAAGTTQLRLSTVDGTAFLDGDGTIPCTSFLGEQIEIVDSAGKRIRGYIKAAGSGETLGDELVTNAWVNSGLYPYETLTTTGKDIDSAINSSGVGIADSTFQPTAGKLLKAVLDVTYSSGSGLRFGFWGAAQGAAVVPDTMLINGTNTFFKTTMTGINYLAFFSSGNDTFSSTNSLKQVLIPSTSGCTIVSSPGGTTYNWNIKQSGFNPNSATFTYRILSTNAPGRQIAGGSLTAANVRLATVDGGAMVHLTDVDLSAYAGDDAGGPVTIINPKSTSAATMTTNKYLLALYDSSGRVATGVIGAVGGGETLSGTELITDWTNNVTYPFETYTEGAGTDITQAANTAGGYGVAYAAADSTAGMLYKYTVDATVTTAGSCIIGMSVSNKSYGYPTFLTAPITTGAKTAYKTSYGYDWFTLHTWNTSACDIALANNSLQRVTDVAATGVHLHSSPNATDRKMKLQTTGFDPNAVTSYKIYRLY